MSVLPPKADITECDVNVRFVPKADGTWAENAELCTAKDKSNILIEPAKYGDANGSCMVQWIVETPGSRGRNYAVHAQCTSASHPAKTQIVNIVIRPQGNESGADGKVVPRFEDLSALFDTISSNRRASCCAHQVSSFQKLQKVA